MNMNLKLLSRAIASFGRSFSVSSKSWVRGKYGQPTEWTHQHIIAKGEVNKGVLKSEFRARRENIAETLIADRINSKTGPVGEKHLLILPAAKRQYMVDKIPYFYRQDTDFRYLTGCLQPDTVLVIEFSRNWSRSILFCKESTPYDEKWEGVKIGYGEAVEFLGVDEASPISSLEDYLYNFQKVHPKLDIWYDYMEPKNNDVHKLLLNFIQQTSSINNLDSARPALHNLRVIKSPAEVALMRETCAIGSEAMRRTIRRSKELSCEGQFLASVEYESRMQGASFLAYPPVVAAGNNANTIHYIASTSAVSPSEFVLMDAGCEYHGYASDITRTWPAAGQFSDGQLSVYEAVLDTQQRLIASIVPGVTTIDGLYKDMQDILGRNLQSIGLIDKDTEYLSARTHEFCPHHVSHYLGMDVHDCGKASKRQPLQPGMVITVEPGCYIPASRGSVDPVFRGIGCRIEDDLLVTEEGVEVLSRDCPKTVKELQDLIA